VAGPRGSKRPRTSATFGSDVREARVSSSKHPKTKDDRDRPRDDLERNPGIGSSKGSFATGEDPESIEADNTVEGDTLNDTTAQGGVDPRHTGRTNK
jgi:hypothetical protein